MFKMFAGAAAGCMCILNDATLQGGKFKVEILIKSIVKGYIASLLLALEKRSEPVNFLAFCSRFARIFFFFTAAISVGITYGYSTYYSRSVQ